MDTDSADRAPQIPASAALLRATIAQLAPRFMQADNLNQSGDWRDLYYLIDYLCFAVDQAYPQIPCKRGCSHCCTTNVFRVSHAEWQVLKSGLLAMPEADRRHFVETARATYSTHRAPLEALAEAWSRGESTPPEAFAASPKQCPLLVDGRCSAYEHRPAICRGYGYFSATLPTGAALPLICQEEGPGWMDTLAGMGIDQLPMPNWHPIQRQIELLNGAQPIKPLPLWLLDEGDALLG